ncbi:hypothetical protein LVJ94_49270 [Pendulispora rubella]|uniref:Uncharacterized protein n=1 Tax=Pendulispora rubella TaxID=2741070 RepID=A0ABZ2L6M3_9BACT
MARSQEFTFRGLGNNDSAVDFTADLQSGDAAEKTWVNASLNSVLASSTTVEDVLAQPHSLAATLLRKSWTPAFGEECTVDFVPGKELNWDRIDPALEVTVPEGTPAHKRTALVFATAMKVQRAMLAGQRCMVHTSITAERAFVTIQLVTNESPEATDADEVARVMSVLQQVASGR